MKDLEAVLVPNNGNHIYYSRVNSGHAGNPRRLLTTISSLASPRLICLQNYISEIKHLYR